jgi:hypothetical protein
MSEGVSMTGNGAAEKEAREISVQQMKRLESELDKARRDLAAERAKGFWARVFQRPATDPGGIEGTRERTRGKIAMSLIMTLIIVVFATIGYLTCLSFDLASVGTEDLNTVIPMVGTTLLTPLVGLIGAITGFYFGGQQALQATSEAHAAQSEIAQTALNAQTQNVTEVARDAATQAAT